MWVSNELSRNKEGEKQFNKNNVQTKLEETENYVRRAVKDIVKELSPIDIANRKMALLQDSLFKIDDSAVWLPFLGLKNKIYLDILVVKIVLGV